MSNEHGKAEYVFDIITSYLRKTDIKFEVKEGTQYIMFPLHADNERKAFIIFQIDQKRSLVSLFAYPCIEFSADKYTDCLYAIDYLNNDLVNSCFILDLSNGILSFRVVQFINPGFDEDIVDYMLGIATNTVLLYREKFVKLADGTMTLSEFMKDDD